MQQKVICRTLQAYPCVVSEDMHLNQTTMYLKQFVDIYLLVSLQESSIISAESFTNNCIVDLMLASADV